MRGRRGRVHRRIATGHAAAEPVIVAANAGGADGARGRHIGYRRRRILEAAGHLIREDLLLLRGRRLRTDGVALCLRRRRLRHALRLHHLVVLQRLLVGGDRAGPPHAVLARAPIGAVMVGHGGARWRLLLLTTRLLGGGWGARVRLSSATRG